VDVATLCRNSLAVQTFALGAGALAAGSDVMADSVTVVELGSDMVEPGIARSTVVLQPGRDMAKAVFVGQIEASDKAAVLQSGSGMVKAVVVGWTEAPGTVVVLHPGRDMTRTVFVGQIDSSDEAVVFQSGPGMVKAVVAG